MLIERLFSAVCDKKGPIKTDQWGKVCFFLNMFLLLFPGEKGKFFHPPNFLKNTFGTKEVERKEKLKFQMIVEMQQRF